MAKIRLKTLTFDNEYIRSQVIKSKYKTIEDIMLTLTPTLMSDLRLSADQTEDLICYLSTICQPKITTASELMKTKFRYIKFGNNALDNLFNGGIVSQTLTELAGPAGVGKTQFCLFLCLQCILTTGTINKETVCYIDTESAFRPERLLQMLVCRGIKKTDALKLLENIHIQNATTVSSFNKIVQSLEILCIEKCVKLLVIDSVASLIRKEFSTQRNFRRSQQLASWASMLKILASKLNVVVLITNQVTTKLKTKDRSTIRSDETEDEFEVCPALGNSWYHFVNTRIILQYDNECRQAVVVKSAISPCIMINYEIRQDGIHFLNHSILTESNPHYPIKTYPGTTIK